MNITRNPSSRVSPVHYHLNTVVGGGGVGPPPRQQLTSMVPPSAHRKGLKHAFTTLYKVKSKKLEFFFFAICDRKSLPPLEGSRGKRRDSLDSWACTEVSICFLALMDKVPSSLLDRQLKGKRKLGVRQENESTYFRYLRQQL